MSWFIRKTLPWWALGKKKVKIKSPKNFLGDQFHFLLCLQDNLPQNSLRKCPSNLTEGFQLYLKWCLSSCSVPLAAVQSNLGACFWWKNSTFGLLSWLAAARSAEKMLEWNDAFISLFSFCIMKALQCQEGKGRFYYWESAVWGREPSVLENISWVVSHVLMDASNWECKSTRERGRISKCKSAVVLCQGSMTKIPDCTPSCSREECRQTPKVCTIIWGTEELPSWIVLLPRLKSSSRTDLLQMLQKAAKEPPLENNNLKEDIKGIVCQ